MKAAFLGLVVLVAGLGVLTVMATQDSLLSYKYVKVAKPDPMEDEWTLWFCDQVERGLLVPQEGLSCNGTVQVPFSDFEN